jgi:hypothetical protein
MNKPSFGGLESEKDYRTIVSDKVGYDGSIPTRGRVPLEKDFTNDLCNQLKLGVCTKCAVRMAAEHYFDDGVRLNEYWGYLIGKTFYDDIIHKFHFEGSSALTMLKAATKYGIPEYSIMEEYPLKIDGTYQEFILDFKKVYGGKIPEAVLENAKKHKIKGYESVPIRPENIARQIAENRVLIVRVIVGDNFYRKENGTYTDKAKYLLPLRKPKTIDSGHLMAMNEYVGISPQQLLAGPNSWGRKWCADNKDQEAGYYNFIFETQATQYFTEAWVIKDILPEISNLVKDLPAAKDFKHDFNENIEYGDKGEEVKNLHIALCILGYLNITVDEWGYFGPKTAKAVLAFQKDNRLLPTAKLNEYGGKYVHSLTRNALNKIF